MSIPRQPVSRQPIPRMPMRGVSPGRLVLVGLLTAWIITLIRGWALMLAFGILHHATGVPTLGYATATLVAFLLYGVFNLAAKVEA
jgi:hypothetical protein